MTSDHHRSEHSDDSSWPAVTSEPRTWDWQGERASSRADRLFRSYESSIPGSIAAAPLGVSSATSAALEAATLAVVALDHEPVLIGVAGALLRSESVASSGIERLDTDAQALATAAAGEARTKSAAAQVWANVRAMETAVAIGDTDELTVGSMLTIHRVLMTNDPHEHEWAGRMREMQNWIGGSDGCPRDALFVPPDPARLSDAMDDLAMFCRRSDLSALAQAAIAHAQFETIHPFTDGNGRTGRALIHTVLRRRGVATRVVAPTSSALLADIAGYFGSLGDYRAGNVDSYLVHFADATTRAAREAVRLGVELYELTVEWASRVKPRRGSTGEAILRSLVSQPVISSSFHGGSGTDAAAVHRAIARLVETDVLTETTGAKRNRIWVAKEVTAILDEFGRRIGRRQSGV